VHALARDPVVTARVITLKGADAGRYYIEETGRYYLDGGEPPGQWHGRGAAALNLSGAVDDDDFLAVMDGCEPGGRLLGTRHTDRTVRGFDVTCSAPKSVSVLFAIGDDHVRSEVLAAHDAAVEAALAWIEDHAHCRHRVNGQIWTVDAGGLIAAAFRQHTSRAHDPQVHTHLVIANRVMARTGVGWPSTLAPSSATNAPSPRSTPLAFEPRSLPASASAGNPSRTASPRWPTPPRRSWPPSPNEPGRWRLDATPRSSASSPTSIANPPPGNAGRSTGMPPGKAGPPRPASTPTSSTTTGTTNYTTSGTTLSVTSPVSSARSRPSTPTTPWTRQR